MDNLANSFSTIQNSQMRRKKSVFLKFSKITWNICTVLFVEGFIQGFERKDQYIVIHLKYSNEKPVIQKISKISLQGRRVYTKKMLASKSLKFNLNALVATQNGANMEAASLSPSNGSMEYSSRVAKGLGIKILSTSKGILSERDARFFGVGGEILCEVF
jgi:small subunit ribosomal protein S8